MAEEEMKNEYEILGIFPCPIYVTKRDSNLDLTEEKEIKDIIKNDMKKAGNYSEGHLSINSYVFNTKLKKIKEFCEQHIETYVKKIISPKEELNFYITQSWLTYAKPGEGFHRHFHSNSIISGVFYISVDENNHIRFHDSMQYQKESYNFEPLEYHLWNSAKYIFNVNKNTLILFPSWLEHDVELTENTTTDRISLAFNVFARGTFGGKDTTDKLIL
jgi:uncharacterized protein (TIGR02466 family)